MGINDDLICNIATDGTTLYTVWQTQQQHGSLSPTIRAYDLNFNQTGPTSKVTVGTGTERRGRDCRAAGPAESAVRRQHDRQQGLHLQQEHVHGLQHAVPRRRHPGLEHAEIHCHDARRRSLGDLQELQTGQWQILRYTNFGGTPTLAATVTGAFVNPIGIAVSTDGNNTLMVADSESGGNVHQQIKAYTNLPAPPPGRWARPAATPPTDRRSPTTSSFSKA